MLIAAGSNARVHVNDPAVTAAGLVGRVTASRRSSRVTLLTDETSAVSALDLKTNAAGIVRHGVAGGEALVLEAGEKGVDVVEAGDVVITAGWRSGRLASAYPRGFRSASSPASASSTPTPADRGRPLRRLLVARLVLVLVEKLQTSPRLSRR